MYVRFAYDSLWLFWKARRKRGTVDLFDDENKHWLMCKRYVKELLPAKSTGPPLPKKRTRQHQSSLKKMTETFSQWNENFRFTTKMISTNTVAFVFLYYLTYTFLFRYLTHFTWPMALVKSYVQSFAKTELETVSFRGEIIFSGIFTAIIHVSHLLYAMKNFQRDKQELFKKEKRMKFLNKPKPKWNSIAINSTHYSGFLIGHLAWGFVICFHMILLLCILLRLIWLQTPNTVSVLNIFIPIIVAYFLRKVIVNVLGDHHLSQRRQKKIDKKMSYNSDHSGIYAVFAYFMFFAGKLCGNRLRRSDQYLCRLSARYCFKYTSSS